MAELRSGQARITRTLTDESPRIGTYGESQAAGLSAATVALLPWGPWHAAGRPDNVRGMRAWGWMRPGGRTTCGVCAPGLDPARGSAAGTYAPSSGGPEPLPPSQAARSAWLYSVIGS